MEQLGHTNSIDVIADLVTLEGQVVIDVGCGDMTFTRQLAERGAHAIGVDPDPDQAARHRAAGDAAGDTAGDARDAGGAATQAPVAARANIAGVTFVEADATALPVADGTADGVFFSFSLHHVPASAYPQVFAEVRRVLKPTGYLCVIEPADCPLNEVMRLFHDEDEVRTAAQVALVRLAVPAFERHRTFRYHSYIEFESFDAFALRYAGKTFNSGYTEADVRRPEVSAAFERAGAPDYRFESPKTMMFLDGPKKT